MPNPGASNAKAAIRDGRFRGDGEVAMRRRDQVMDKAMDHAEAAMRMGLGGALFEQQAAVCLLLGRIPLLTGERRQIAFITLVHALAAHLAVLEMLLPILRRHAAERELRAAMRHVSSTLEQAIVGQRVLGTTHHLQAVMSAVLPLFGQEAAMLEEAFDELPEQTHASLARDAEQLFVGLIGPFDLEDLLEQDEAVLLMN